MLQISAAPNSHWYLIELVTFWKMMTENKWIVFFGVKSHCFLPRLHSLAKAVQYADETSFHNSANELGNDDLTFSLNVNTD